LKRCWLLIVSRRLEVWLPPELYLTRSLAEREVERWRTVLRIPMTPRVNPESVRSLSLVESEFPEAWYACPVWMGLAWTEKSFPDPKIDLMAADEAEATTWLRRRTPKGIQIDHPGQVEFQRRGIRKTVGIWRVKRVMGF
jgi:hypothetical protein